MKLETLMLSRILRDEDFARKVLPFVKPEYFVSRSERTVYELIHSHTVKYNSSPTQEALAVELSNKAGLTEDDFKDSVEVLEEITTDPQDHDKQWLIDSTEKWCQDRALFNALMESVSIANGSSKDLSKGSIPKMLTDALAISFDPSVGHDFLDDFAARYEFYHHRDERIPFGIEKLDEITEGGVPRKTLNIFISGTGGGKSLMMCSLAAHNLLRGKNVLYITLEMSEEKIAERIDANLLDTPIKELKTLTREFYEKKILRIKGKTTGKLVIKEYPTASAHVGNFRHLLNELRLKKSFVPDIIFIDYMNICASARVKAGAGANSYTLIKSVAEELRGLAVEFNVPLFTATQFNRSGFVDSDAGMEHASDSFGIAMTADLMLALISTEELNELNQIMIKQLKNRFSDPNLSKKFVVGVDKSRMRIYDAEQSAQEGFTADGDGTVFGSSKFGNRVNDEGRKKRRSGFQ